MRCVDVVLGGLALFPLAVVIYDHATGGALFRAEFGHEPPSYWLLYAMLAVILGIGSHCDCSSGGGVGGYHRVESSWQTSNMGGH